jgi:hypothetical protein
MKKNQCSLELILLPALCVASLSYASNFVSNAKYHLRSSASTGHSSCYAWEYIVLRIISLNTLCGHCNTVLCVILILFNSFLILRFLQTNETLGVVEINNGTCMEALINKVTKSVQVR